MKFKERIKRWLLSEEIDKYNQATKILEKSKTSYDQAFWFTHEAKANLIDAERNYVNAQDYLTKVFDVGIDVHMQVRNNEYSWAVVCVKGKPEYIKFIPLNHGETREVIEFLKRFGGSNRVVDCPFAWRQMIEGYTI